MIFLTSPILTYLFTLKKRNHTINLFIIYLISTLLWQFFDIIIALNLPNIQIAALILRITIPTWLLLPTILLYIINDMLGRKKSVDTKIITYILSAVLPIIMFTDLIINEHSVALSGHFVRFNFTILQSIVVGTLLICPFVYVLGIMCMAIKHPKSVIQKYQMIYIVIGTITSFSATLIFNVILPQLGIKNIIPPSGSIFLFFQLAAIFFAILHYKILSLSLDEVTGSILFQIKDGVILLDQNNHIVQANSIATPLIKHLNFMFKIPTDDQYSHQEVSFNIDQETKTFLISRSILKHKNLTAGTLLILKDMTAQTKIIQQLHKTTQKAEHMNKRQSTLLSEISYEIQHPLFLINQAIKQLMKSDLSQNHHLEAIKTAEQNLSILLNDILDLSRIEEGHLSIISTWFQLDELIQELKQLFDLKIKAKGLTLIIEQKKIFSGMVYLDPQRIKQILINLLNNAIKFTHQGTITLLIQYQNTTEDMIDLVISVIDTGIGIPTEQQNTIFVPFQQQEMQDNRKYGGTGLGLTIVKEILKELKGEITLKSSIDSGSNFTIYLKNTPFKEHLGMIAPKNLNILHKNNEQSIEVIHPILLKKLYDIKTQYQHTLHPPVIINELSNFIHEIANLSNINYPPLKKWLTIHQKALTQFDVLTLSVSYKEFIEILDQIQDSS